MNYAIQPMRITHSTLVVRAHAGARATHAGFRHAAAVRAACVLWALSLQTGCALFPGLAVPSQDLVRHLPPDKAAQVESWTQNAWATCAAKKPNLAASDCYAQGFRDGYINRLALGARWQWWAGYRHGSWLALQDQLWGTTPLEPTPLSCTSPSMALAPDWYEADSAAGGSFGAPAGTEATELQPEPIYTLDADHGITAAPPTTDSETRPAPQQEPHVPRRTQPRAPSSPDVPPSRPSVPSPLDLELTPHADAQEREGQTLPREQGQEPREGMPPIDDDLDLLSPFGNAVPPADGQDRLESEGTPPSGRTRDAGSQEQPTEDVNSFDLQIHDGLGTNLRPSGTEAPVWQLEDLQTAGPGQASFYARSVGPSDVRQAVHTEAGESHRQDVSTESSGSSFFATAITSPAKSGGGGSILPATIPVKRNVWYFDQQEEEADEAAAP